MRSFRDTDSFHAAVLTFPRVSPCLHGWRWFAARPGSDPWKFHTSFLLTFYWLPGHTWLQGILGNLVFGWGVLGPRKRKERTLRIGNEPQLEIRVGQKLLLWLSSNILWIKCSLKCEHDVNIIIITSVFDLPDNWKVKYQGEVKWEHINMKLLDFLGQNYF